MPDYNYATFPLDMDGPLFAAFAEHLGPGQRAPDGTLTELATGEQVLLSSLWKRGPLVLEFGSQT